MRTMDDLWGPTGFEQQRSVKVKCKSKLVFVQRPSDRELHQEGRHTKSSWAELGSLRLGLFDFVLP